MFIAVTGGYGHYKTLFATNFAWLIADMFKVKLGANYTINKQDLVRFRSLSDVEGFQGVAVFDEMMKQFDSRQPSQNIAFSNWLNQSRKSGVITIVTCANLGLVDLRFRNLVDFEFRCVKYKDGHALVYQIDYQAGRVVRVFKLLKPSKFYGTYNRNEIVDLLAMPRAAP